DGDRAGSRARLPAAPMVLFERPERVCAPRSGRGRTAAPGAGQKRTDEHYRVRCPLEGSGSTISAEIA
ncbi:MAG: hypothetical protein ABS918_07575, partial [Saccharopolyspora rectivirgula]